MINPTISILRHINDSQNRRLKVLTFPTHEGYQSLLQNVNHDFYMITGPNIKGWDFHTRPLPSNHYMLPTHEKGIILDEDIDIVLSQNRGQHIPILQQLIGKMRIPIINIDHTEPPPGILPKQLEEIQNLRVHKHAFITDHNKRTWRGQEEDVIIRHGIDTDLFNGWSGSESYGISVVNFFPQRDVFCGWNLWNEILSEGQLTVKLIGFNPDLRTPSINDPIQLNSELSKARFYLNTSQWSPVPMSMLEAMACGCPVVSTAKQEIPNIIINGVNGFVSNDKNELINACKKLIEDHDLARKIGEAGRQTILNNFSLDKFVKNWNEFLWSGYNECR